MPMPHRTFAQVAKRRLVGKEGRERIREVNALLAELPDYKNGPYADLRKWLPRRDRGVPRPVERRPPRLDRGPPRGRGPDRPGRAAQRRQVVDPPGAVRDPDQDGRLPVHDAPPDPGADPDRWRPRPARRDPRADRGRQRRSRRGHGRCSASFASADAIVYCARADADPEELRPVRAEVDARRHRQAGVPRRDARRRGLAGQRSTGSGRRFPDLEVVPVSVIDEASLEAFREAAWRLTGLIRVRLRTDGRDGPGAARARSRRDGRGRRRLDPPRRRGDVHRRPRLGPVGPLRRPARRARPRRPGRRRRRDPPLTSD